MLRPSRRDFLKRSLVLGALSATGQSVLNSGCGPASPAPYFPPAGLDRAFSGPVNQLRAVSLRPDRIDLFYFAAGQLRHKWLDVTSPGMHRWGPDGTGPGEPLGVYEYPTPVVFLGEKLALFATSGDPSTISFRQYDPGGGWTDWRLLPGRSVSRVVGFDGGDGTVRIFGLDSRRFYVSTQLVPYGGELNPGPWDLLPSYGDGGRLNSLGSATPAHGDGGGGVVFGRMDTGALVYSLGGTTSWQSVPDAPGGGCAASSAYYLGFSARPLFFVQVPDGAGGCALRLIHGDHLRSHYEDLGPSQAPPHIVSQSPARNLEEQQWDLFTTARMAGSDRSAVQWAHVTWRDLLEHTIRWQPLASDLSSGGENLTALSSRPGRLDLFVTDVGGNVWHKWNDARTSLGWQPGA